MRIDALVAFYRSEKSCDNGHTALGDAYPFMLAQYSTAGNDDNIHAQCAVCSITIEWRKNELMTIQRQETAQSPPAPTAYWSTFNMMMMKRRVMTAMIMMMRRRRGR